VTKYIGLAIFGLFLLVVSVKAQNTSLYLEGVVYDAQSKLPLIGAIVGIGSPINERIATNADGSFKLPSRQKENVDAFVTYLGYKPLKVNLIPGIFNKIFLEIDETSLSGVEIEGERFRELGTRSLSVSNIGKEEISRNTMVSLGTLLSGIQGVSFASFGSNIQLPIIHGLYGNRILILNNGFKHGFQNWGSDHAPEIDIQSAESISVIKGAAAVRFGPDALGGVVITESRSMPFNSTLNGSAVAGYQTNGRGFNKGINLSEGYGNWSWHIGGNVNIVGDRHTPDYMLTNTGAREYSAFGGAKFKINENLIAKANYSFR